MSSIYTSGNDKYFYSNKIKVFPCAYRNSTYDATARLNTEYNFTHLPHTVDKKSYIIKFNGISENEPKAELICVIQGYYFEIELDDSDPENKDSSNLENKYLNICVASPNQPNGTDFIEGQHLCSWASINTEDTLDIKSGSDTFFAGLKIGDEALSKDTYQCYALKLDASAMLPISASKIENSAGVPISNEFTTRTLSAATSISTPELSVAGDKLIAKFDGITANVPVTINSALEVKDSTATTSILKAEDTEVTINRPTNIEGANSNLTVAGTGDFGGKLTVSKDGASITGNTQISKSSSEATDGNLKVTGTGEFGNKLTVTSGGAEITGATEIKGDSGNLKVEGTGEFGSKLTVNGEPEGLNDAVRKRELDNTFWLSGGKQLPNNVNLNNYTTVGNYFYVLDVGSNVTNLPTNADMTFTLKVTALAEGQFIQQQLCDVSGNVYTRTFTPASEGIAATWSEWSLVLTSETYKSLSLDRDIAKRYMRTSGDPDVIIVSVSALIEYVRDNYATDARIKVGDTTGATSIYRGIVIEGLPSLTEYTIHVDLKARHSDAWITVENFSGKIYQCFWNSAYNSTSSSSLAGHKPIWKMLPTTGDIDGSVDKDKTPGVPDGNIGSASQPIYLVDGQLTESNANIGGANQPIWMQGGELKTCSGPVGGENQPIYMNSEGTLTACKYAYTVTDVLPSEPQADTIYFITED